MADGKEGSEFREDLRSGSQQREQLVQVLEMGRAERTRINGRECMREHGREAGREGSPGRPAGLRLAGPSRRILG